jgi:hypothetical protein
MSEEKVKLYTRVTPDVDVQIVDLASRYNTTKSAINGILISIGLSYFKAIIDPEGLISSKKLAEILVESEKLGAEFTIPDELKGKEV